MKKELVSLLLNLVPVVLMILAIPVISNDYALTAFYIVVICTSFIIRYDNRDYWFFFFGLFAMAISEYFFISTGVETFERKSLLGVMPLWLPVLWAYVFVVIKRAIKIVESI